MGRCGSVFSVVIRILLIGSLAGCGSSNNAPAAPTVPASIALTPSTASLEVGLTQNFTVSAKNSSGAPLAVAVTFNSSNPAVLTIANSGVACGGTWDSLTNPIVCTPGPVGVATLTASAAGVSSAPVTVFVHQHIDNISITQVTSPISPPTCAVQSASGQINGISQNQIATYQATVSSRGNDITATVGPLTWTTLSNTIVKVSNTVSGIGFNQAQATADVPGETQIFVNAGGVNGPAVNFATCPVKSIALAVTDSAGDSFTLATGGSKTITATVTDTLNTILTNVPLTWSTSEPTVATVTGTKTGNTTGIGSTGTVRAVAPGGAAIIASCTPPSCNNGVLTPTIVGVTTLPIYSTGIVQVIVTGTKASITTVWATSTGCGTNFNCGSAIVSINTSNNAVSSASSLPNPPNSLVFNPQGTTAFLGSSKGLMVVDPAASPPKVSTFNGVTGRVLAVSPDGNKAVVSDTSITATHAQQDVSIFDQANSGSRVDLLISGVTAAEFSPDGLKVYMVGANTNNLYVYSSVDGLKTIPLTAPANDVSFFSNGAFAYLAGGAASAVTVRATCDNSEATSTSTSTTPQFIRSLTDGVHVLALDSPVSTNPPTAQGIDVITASSSPIGCPPTITDTNNFANLGQGTFTPLQLIVSTDGLKAYVLASNLGSVLAFDVNGQTTSAIPLVGANPKPLSGSLTPDGILLYVASSDGTVHVIDTLAATDFQQVSLPVNFNFCSNVSFTCTPDLVAVRP
jgi:hypothetical protein